MYRILFLILSAVFIGCSQSEAPVNSWQSLANFPGTNPLFLTSVQNKLIVGQGNANAELERLWIYTPETDQWQEISATSVAGLSGFSYFTLNDTFYLGFGRRTTSSEPYPSLLYKYDLSSNQWSLISGKVTHAIYPGIDEASDFIKDGWGYALFGGSQQRSLNTFPHLDAVRYSPQQGLEPVKVTLVDTPVFSSPHSAYDLALANLSAFRYKGFSFILNNRLYHGGGNPAHLSAFTYFQPSELNEVFQHDFFQYELLPGELRLQKRLSTTYNLQGSLLGFAFNNEGYVATADGTLIRFTPDSNTWQAVVSAPAAVKAGSVHQNKLYFITGQQQLWCYTPN